MTDQKARRMAVAKAFREHKVPLRKGHWKIQGAEVVWWVNLRSDSPLPTAALGFEIGAWVAGAGPEPEGGAIDCPLLADQALGADPAAQTAALVAQLQAIGTVAELDAAVGADAFPEAYLDATLREILGR
jgi:hypothetical protein